LDDVLIGVQNNLAQPVQDFLLSGPGSFAFDGDECIPSEGLTILPIDLNYGRIAFNGTGLAPGASAYFCLETPATVVGTGPASQQIPFTINVAPMGLTDYGLNGKTNSSYTYAAHSFSSTTELMKLGIGNSSDPKLNQQMSLQLNVMAYGIATSANNGTYWAQDVFVLDNSTDCSRPICYSFASEIFNQTSWIPQRNSFGVLGSGEAPRGPFASNSPLNLCTFGNEINGTMQEKNCADLAHQSSCSATIYTNEVSPDFDTYVCYAPKYSGLTVPFSINQKVVTGIQKGGPYDGAPFVSFGYQLSELSKGSKPGKFIQFDKVYFDNRLESSAPKFAPEKCAIDWVKLPKGVRCPAFVVSGDQPFSPGGLFNDAEIVLCGNGNGASVTLTSLNAYMKLYHDNVPIPHAYSFGFDTGEQVTNVLSSAMKPNKQGWKADYGIGPDNLSALY
jgi:hypothetical protein